MLSSPPPSFAACDERARGVVEVVARLDDGRGSSLVADHVGQPVGAEQEEVAGLGLDRERVDVDVGLGAERARDHRALRVRLRLLGRELAAAHELGDERVVVGQLLELAVADAVGARVADVAERDVPVARRRARPSSSCPSPTVAASSSERSKTRAVRLLDQRRRRAPRRARRRSPPRARPPRAATRSRRPARRPSRPRSRRAAARRRRRPRSGGACGPVSVTPCDAAEPHASTLRSVWPTRTTSPLASRRGVVTRAPLTNVPFVEPRSSTQTPSRRGSKRACRAEANSSPSSGTVVLAAAADRDRHRVDRDLARPPSSAGLLRTTSSARCGRREPAGSRPRRGRGSCSPAAPAAGPGWRCGRCAR